MKKFKTKNKIKKIRIIMAIIFFLILFIIISFFKLNSSHQNIISKLLNDFDNQKAYSFRFLTSNLDSLFNSYSFNDNKLLFKGEQKTIYLYNTHDKENYNDNSTIYDATKLLKDNISKLGIKVIQEDSKTSELLHTGLSYYNISRSFIKNVMQNNRDISYYIDIHRDSVDDTSITINGKKYAKILFVLGLDNKNYLNNKSHMLKMDEYLNNNYPGISKGIYEKKGSGVDGVYNQDLSDKVILIEIGGVKNNLEEVNNSTEIISLMLYHVLGD